MPISFLLSHRTSHNPIYTEVFAISDWILRIDICLREINAQNYVVK